MLNNIGFFQPLYIASAKESFANSAVKKTFKTILRSNDYELSA
jgi:hypothetical protein